MPHTYQTPTARVTGANTNTVPTGSNVVEVFEATERCYVNDIEFQGLGDNDASAGNVWLVNRLLRKLSLPAEASYSGGAGITSVSSTLGKYLKPGDKILVTVEVLTGSGWDVALEVGQHYSDFNV